MNMHPALLGRGDRLQGLCQLVSDFKGQVPVGGCGIEPKIDGIRMLWIDGELVTREGVPIHGADHIAAELRRMEHEACVPLFIDGEWQVGGTFDATRRHFMAKGGLGNAGIFHVFDVLEMRQWRGQDVSPALHARKRKLEALCQPLDEDGPVRQIPWAWVETEADARRVAADVIAAGGEGVILKHANATYRPGRSTNWLRIKKSQTWDCRILDLIGRQENEDQLATMIVDLDGQRVRVSAGFSDRQRFDFMLQADSLRGMMAEIEAMERTERGHLREARFVRLRDERL